LKRYESLEAVRALTRFIGIGGMYAEEALLRARVDKNRRCESLSDGELESIFGALQELVQPLRFGKLEPCIVFDEGGKWVDAVPVSLRRYEGFECKRFGSVNDALDEFYTKTSTEQETGIVAGKFEEEMARQQRILTEQKESLEKAKKEAEEMRKIGDKIYAHFHQLQTLTQRIMSEKRDEKTWQEIVSTIESEKQRGEVPAVYFQSLDARNLALNLSIDSVSFSLRLRDSVQKNAAACYNHAKKSEKKVEGAEKAIKETLRSMEEVRQKREVAVEKVAKPAKKERKAWYEKFRWFHTSEGLLVVGGKDAVSNEVLIKRHTEPHDLVFHADIEGAPFVVIKTEGKTPSQQSINEAAQLAASHSRAWKAKFSTIDVYWVQPDQVSKTPPSGEYLSKGAFMVRGRKNYLRKTPLQLAIGVDAKVTPLILIGGPKEAVKNKTEIYVKIVPGDFSSKELAGRIRHTLKQKISEERHGEVSRISLEEIQALIPFGKGSMTNQ
ncbi:MAG: ribosome rescue protein RqcH, partial [Candidatus Bathyarchaeia archaeon]